MTTRGKSPLNPTKRERDALIQLWCDRRDVATIVLYMESQGYRLKYLSEVLKFCVENIREQVIRQGTEYVSNSATATALIEDRFSVSLNPANRGKKNYVNNLLLDSGYSPAVEDRISLGITPRQNIQGSGFTPDDIAEMKRKSQESFQDSELLSTRAEKDAKVMEEEKDAFAALAGLLKKEEEDGGE